jgi:18S rRNA (guanine1575-N7)-methyltransferase
MGKTQRPEHTAPPELFYNEEEAQKYTTNTHISEVQAKLTQRALELLALPDDGQPRLLLDLGCGSGLSGYGHQSSYAGCGARKRSGG